MVEYLLSSSDEPSLKATVLSCYDLPHERQPASVVLEILGASVETGPPVARHRERNSFKFFGVEEGKPSNELIVTSEKLSSLFSSTATFRVKFDEHGQEDMIAKFQISRRLHVNETKCKTLEPPFLLYGMRGDSAHMFEFSFRSSTAHPFLFQGSFLTFAHPRENQAKAKQLTMPQPPLSRVAQSRRL